MLFWGICSALRAGIPVTFWAIGPVSGLAVTSECATEPKLHDEPHRFDAPFLLPARTARRYPNDFAAGRSPVISLMKAQIDRAQGDGRLVVAPADEVALCLSALAQGLVSMQRAGRFDNDDHFTEHYRRTMFRAFSSFLPDTPSPDSRAGREQA